ncbi:MAG: His-Xaa-Ser system radical SAM maturase HxsB [Nanoarchaeota archaeon]|nr:His-Xaa-Ser system radical SAM maturase HxsB [Nanoarchaeota archaeon]
MDLVKNFFRTRRIDDNYFLTNDYGGYCILNEKEYGELRSGSISDELKQRLRNSHILIDEKDLDRLISLTKKRYSFLMQGTSLHIIIPTLRCNMKCIYCHASSRPVDDLSCNMDEEIAKKTVDFIFQSPAKGLCIEFQGGEPLLNWPILKFVVSYAKELNKSHNKNLLFTVVTNLSLMDEDKMNFFIDEGVDICTSLDGHKELHDKNRLLVGGSNYDQVLFWLKKINEEYLKRGIKEKRVHALPTITKESLKYSRQIIDEYIKLGLKEIHIRFLNNLGVAKDSWFNINYSVYDFMKFWIDSVEYIKELQKQGIEINERMVKIMFSKIETGEDPNYLDLRSPCGAAIGQLAYSYNGDIFTCDEARMIGNNDLFLLGNVKFSKYSDIVTCDKACATVNSSINDQYICDTCAYKPYCGLCPVCAYAEQGTIITKVSDSSRCKIFKQQFDWVIKEKFINLKISK